MATITLKGNPIHTSGNLPETGSKAADFTLVNKGLEDVSLSDFSGKRVVLNIFPSIDTGVCAASVRTFNQKVSEMDNTAVLCISKDLPFALGRFCGAEGIENVEVLSGFRDEDFDRNYHVQILDGPLKGVYSRAVVVLDENGKILYTEQVPEIAQDPDFEAVYAVLN